ncbi:MAG: tetratricopeptide repeat protein [Acidobacteria bacterium]|nr:tetratricopeptide repeat protein [Acidobacteriota bacterium]
MLTEFYPKAKMRLRQPFEDGLPDQGTRLPGSGNLTASIEGYSKAIELVPRNAKFYNGRGISYMMLEQDGLARKDFDKAIRSIQVYRNFT